MILVQQQGDPRVGADAANAHHLAGQMGHPVPLQQALAVGRQRLAVGNPPHPQVLQRELGVAPLRQLLDRHDQRRVAGEPRHPVHRRAQLVERLQAVVGARLRDRPPDAGRALGVERCLKPRQQRIDVEARVPDIEHRHAGERPHGLPVGADRAADHGPSLTPPQAVLATSDLDARRQPLDIPLPRPAAGLVEVVQIEDEPPLRRAEYSEIGEVRIAAQLHLEAGRGRSRKVGRHRQRGAPEVRKRRRQHPTVPDRHKLRDPRLGLLGQQVDGVVRAQRGLPDGVRGSAHRPAQTPAFGRTLNLDRVNHHTRSPRAWANHSPAWIGSLPDGNAADG